LVLISHRQRISTRLAGNPLEWAHKFSTAARVEEKELNISSPQLSWRFKDGVFIDKCPTKGQSWRVIYFRLLSHIRSLIEETFADVSRNSTAATLT